MGQVQSFLLPIDPALHRPIGAAGPGTAASTPGNQYEALPDFVTAKEPTAPKETSSATTSPAIKAPEKKGVVPYNQANYQTLYGLDPAFK